MVRSTRLGLVMLLLLGGIAGSATTAGSAGLRADAPRIACTCRANGRSYPLGERVCLPTPEGFRIAECRMVQNVTSWLFSTEACVVSALQAWGP